MKIFQKILCVGALSICTIAFADNLDTGLIQTTPTTPQSFQQANNPVTNAPNNSSEDASAALSASNAAATAALTQTVQGLNTAMTTEKQDDQQTLDAINQKMATMSQATLDLQQKTAQQILQLTQKNLALEHQVQSLVVILQAMNQQVAKLHDTNSPWTAGELALFILLVIIICLLLILIFKRSKNRRISVTEKPVDFSDAEYDFLGSAEGVGARLDLAQVYIDMDDASEAIKILTSVLRDGNADEKKRAKELLDSMKKV